MKSVLSFLLVLVLAASCSPARRLNRLLALHPGLKTPDTLFIRDTIPIREIETDTILHLDSIHDTVIIQRDRLEIKVHRHTDSLFIGGQCKADTIYLDRKIPVEKIKMVASDKMDHLISKIPWLVSGLIVLAGLVVFLVRKFHG